MPFYLYGLKLLGKSMKDIFFFPVWWYTSGLFQFLLKIKEFIVNRERGLALSVWIKNIFTPMFGQRDWQGMLISFFIRVVQIIFRGVIMIFWILLSVCLLCIWMILPILTVYEIFYQLGIF